MKPSASWFTRLTRWIAHMTGRPFAFVAAVMVIVLWALSGPLLGFGDSWQMIVNTITTTITFLMVFVIQSTQNRDTEALHIKVDELIRAIDGTHKALLDLEELDEDDLDRIRDSYEELARKARERLRKDARDVRASDPEGRQDRP